MTRGLKIWYIVVAILFVTSCGSYDKLVKSKDYDAMYHLAIEYLAQGKESRTIDLLEQVQPIFEGTLREDSVSFYIAKAKYMEGSYSESGVLFNNFRKVYSRSVFAPEAEYLYAMSFYEESPNFELDQNPTRLAIAAFSEYISNHPNEPRADSAKTYVKELTNRLYDRAAYIGQTYYNIGAYNSAISAFTNSLKEYPNSPKREESKYLIVKSNYQFARKSVNSKKRERYYNTMDAAYNFLTEYKESEYSKEVSRILKDAQRLSKGEIFTDSLGKTLPITEHEILKANKYYEKLFDKAEGKKISEEEMQKQYDSYLEKLKKKLIKRKERDENDEDLYISPLPSGDKEKEDRNKK